MGGEFVEQVSILYCKKIESFLYPPKVERNKSWFETDEIPNVPMKRTCEHYMWDL